MSSEDKLIGESGRSAPLGYASRFHSDPAQVNPGRAAAAGFCVAFVLMAGTVALLSQGIIRYQATYAFAGLVFAGGLTVAVILNWVFGYRGFFAGFLIGIGLFLIFPCATLTVICGRLDKPMF